MEADFGQIYVDFPEGRRPVSVLIMVWSYSNYPFAVALPTQRTEAILEGMVRGFEHFGCVPREVWWDNPKTVALTQLDRTDLLICDELGYLSFSRAGAELLFQVFADRYERKSLLITSNLPFSNWGQIFQGERMTAALLDRLTHHCEIFQMNGESYRFRESMKKKAGRKAK